MDKTIFDNILNTFENEDIKEFAKTVIDEAPDYWFHVGASSTGKYHPDYALGDGGLVRHTLGVVRFLNHIYGIESIANQYTSRERDLLRVAAIAHDMWKSGTQEEYEKSKWTRFDHPLLSARHIYNMVGLTEAERRFIGMAISSHMGQWNTDKRHPDVTLPKPQDKYQVILHLADYLASRKDIELVFDDAKPSISEPEPLPDINTWTFPFGKFAGKTIAEVNAEAPWYIKWAKENLEKEPARSLVRSFVE